MAENITTHFPTSFVETADVCKPEIGRSVADESLAHLNTLGLEVRQGLGAQELASLLAIAHQPHIRDAFCPDDVTDRRFATVESASEWLAKGRAMFTLLEGDGVVGYGWTGPGTSAEVPDGETTVALRLGEMARGRGLAESFAIAIIAHSAREYGARGFWAEPWESNAPSMRICQRGGFEVVSRVQKMRRTPDGTVLDNRMFLRLPDAVLSSFMEAPPAA